MKAKFLIGLLAIVTIIISCGGKDTTPAPPQVGTGDYAPYTLGSTFTYESTGTGQQAQDVTLTVTIDTTVDGLVYKKLSSDKPAVFPSRYVNYTNGVQREAQFNINLNNTVIQKLILTNFKEAEAVSANWNENQTFNISAIPFPLTVNFVHTVTAKAATRQVITTNFTNVIGVRSVGTLQIPSGITLPAGTATSFVLDNYYSKSVGLIERITATQTLKLKAYTIR
jgi:hypothetical protein